MKYEEAMAELEKISIQMENNELGIDQLAEKLNQAKELIKFCRAQLVNIEQEIQKILSDEEK
ncbi:MAG: exodeoxyribonuclease VII small subunit [Bacteroidaceae bacterium]|nr:exodeoxyribonuclease VII small subunit [Bacteroidaceae bacterium]